MKRYKRGGRFSWEKQRQVPVSVPTEGDGISANIAMIMMTAIGLLFDITFWWALTAIVLLTFTLVLAIKHKVG